MARFSASRTRASSSGLAFGLAVSKKVANCRRLGIGQELEPALALDAGRRRVGHVRRDVDLARLERRHAGGVVRDDAVGDRLELRRAAPVRRVGGERDVAVLPVLLEHPGPRADRRLVERVLAAGLEVLGGDLEAAVGEHGDHVARGLGERQHDRRVVDDGDLLQEVLQPLAVVERGEELLQAELGRRRVEGLAVAEPDAGAELELEPRVVEPPVVGGQELLDDRVARAVAVPVDQRLADLGEDADVRRGGVVGIEVRRVDELGDRQRVARGGLGLGGRRQAGQQEGDEGGEQRSLAAHEALLPRSARGVAEPDGTGDAGTGRGEMRRKGVSFPGAPARVPRATTWGRRRREARRRRSSGRTRGRRSSARGRRPSTRRRR